MEVAAATDRARRRLGFLTLAETAALAERGIVVLDPQSTLVAPAAAIEPGVVLWPGVTIAVGEGGRVAIGPDAEIGEEGGFTIRAETATITVGAGARLIGGGALFLDNAIGHGAQILGPIRARHCRLGDGDTHRDPDPDRRGGVLKGVGDARDLDVPQGHVVQAFGLFHEAPLRRQREFHPRPG